jgi:hypothetical protein
MARPSKRSPYLSHFVKPAGNDDAPYNARLASRVVDDPYDNTKRPATARVDADVLGLLLARGRIKHHHFKTGRDLEEAFERASITGVKAMDFSKEPVDGGRGFSDPYNDAKRRAGDFVAHAQRALGDSAFRLVQLALQERHTIDEVAGALRCDKRFVIARLRDALEKLATATGNAGVGPYRRIAHDKHSAAAARVFKAAA